MDFIPPTQQPDKLQEWKNREIREQRRLRREKIARPGFGKIVKNQLGTKQGVSTLKLILMYSIMGMVLAWLLPIVIQMIQPEMQKDDAQYYGMIGAIAITLLFLVVSLLKGVILRNRTKRETSASNRQNSHTFAPNHPNNRNNR